MDIEIKCDFCSKRLGFYTNAGDCEPGFAVCEACNPFEKTAVVVDWKVSAVKSRPLISYDGK